MPQQDQSSQKPLRVIVVGAGLVGLSLSHALQLANIDHVVLEKNDKIVSVRGAALMLFPGTARILDQFGILKNILDAMTPMQRQFQRWPDGSINANESALLLLEKEFGMPTILFDRQRCVEQLYDGLPDQSKIRTSARVERIEHTATGIKVFLTDGTYEEGDVVVGADGVHSLVRQIMWDYAAEHEPTTIPDSDKTALTTQYKGIFGISDQCDYPDVGPADIHTVLGEATTQLLFTGGGRAYWSLTYKDEYSQPPKLFKPNQQEQDEIAHRFKDVHITEALTFGQLYKNRVRSGVLNIEEGILKQWHAGRFVLVGDAAHKMTADLGQGANMAIESAASLANVLHSAVTQTPSSTSRFTTAELSSLFDKYQSERYPRAKTFVKLSGTVTRMRSYETWWKKILISRISVLPFMRNSQSKKFMNAIAKAPKLDYVKTRTINEDAPGWKIVPDEDASMMPWVMLSVSAIVVGISYVAMTRRDSRL